MEIYTVTDTYILAGAVFDYRFERFKVEKADEATVSVFGGAHYRIPETSVPSVLLVIHIFGLPRINGGENLGRGLLRLFRGQTCLIELPSHEAVPRAYRAPYEPKSAGACYQITLTDHGLVATRNGAAMCLD